MLYLVDPYGYQNHGHHWHVSIQLAQALIELNRNFVFISPSADLLSTELQLPPKNSFFEVIKTDSNKFRFLEDIHSLIAKLNNENFKSLILFSWLPLFSNIEFEMLVNKIVNPLISIVGITSLSQKSCENYDLNYKFELEEIFYKSDNCKVLWVWHEPNPKNFAANKIRRLPEYHSHVKKVNVITEEKNLSFFGRLSYSRGFSELLIIGLTNPKLRIFARGLAYKTSGLWRPSKNYYGFKRNPIKAIYSILVSYMLASLRKLPNVHIEPIPYSTEKELNLDISKSQFVFVCCKNPLSSGIALTALASGVPVIWWGKEGEGVRNLSFGYPKGKINYIDIFIPGRILKKMESLTGSIPLEIFSWDMFKEEICLLNSLYQET